MTLDIAFQFVIVPEGDTARVELTDHRADSYHTGKLPNEAVEDKLLELQSQFTALLQPYIVGQTTTHTAIHVSISKPKTSKR